MILFAILSFFLFGYLGLRFHKGFFWIYADAIYYPLIAIGAVLLFFESEDLRSVLQAEAEETALELQLNLISSRRPALSAAMSSAEHVRGGAQLLLPVLNTARSCERAFSASPTCLVLRDMEPAIERAFQTLSAYSGPEELFELCSVANEVFIELEGLPFRGFSMRVISSHFREGLQLGFHDTDYFSVVEYLQSLRPEMEADIPVFLQEFQGYVGYELEEAEAESIRETRNAEIIYGQSIMMAFEVCLRLPDSIRSGAFSTWVNEQSNAEIELDDARMILEDLRSSSNEPNRAALFRLQYWPYIVITALALKFGKGVASIRSAPNPGTLVEPQKPSRGS